MTSLNNLYINKNKYLQVLFPVFLFIQLLTARTFLGQDLVNEGGPQAYEMYNILILSTMLISNSFV